MKDLVLLVFDLPYLLSRICLSFVCCCFFKKNTFIRNNLSDIFHSAQNCWILYHSKFIIERQTALIEEDYFLTSLLTSWIHFLINLSFCLMENENNK